MSDCVEVRIVVVVQKMEGSRERFILLNYSNFPQFQMC